ncbi:MAG TPA: hypothetical protein PKJ34_13965 [Anaerolineaceae bacterium]|nr:hypothetical protein [Anaerolineaceae bacterium]
MKITPEMAYPCMETSRLVLRALKMEDAEFIYREWGRAGGHLLYA